MGAENSNQTDKPRFVGEWIRLGDVATYINGYAFKPSDYSDAGLPIIRIQDLTGNVYQTNRYEGILPERYAVDDGDILISWSASLGVFEWNGGPAWLNQHIFKVSFDKMQVDKRFFAHQARFLVEASANLAHGATMRHLTKKVFDSLPFFFPRAEHQKAIADQLDGIDMQLRNATNQLCQLDSLVKSRFVEMFNDHCARVKLSEICDTYNGDRGKNYPSEKDRVEKGIPFVNASHLSAGKVSFENMDYITEERYALLSGGKISRDDILYCLRGSLGKCAIADFECGAIASSMMLIRPDQKKILPAFLYQALISPEVTKQLEAARNGSTQPNLSAKSVRNYLVSLPNLDSQRKFVAFARQIGKLRFAGSHEMNFRCERFTLS